MIYTMKSLSIIDDLKQKGFRITKIRKSILDIFQNNKHPLSASEIGKLLLKKDISANKTTIYRELDFLSEAKLVKDIDFGDGKKRYEALTNKHHHHAVCVNCGAVEDIELNLDISKDEKNIKDTKGFKVLDHSIEIFGLCKKCQ